MARKRSLGGLLILFCLFTFAFFLPSRALASPTPPPTGDWTIEVGEEVTLDGQDLTLPGSVIVNGHLTLNNCTLRFTPTSWEEKTLTILGTLDAMDTTVTSASGEVVGVMACGTSVTNLTSCTLDYVESHFSDHSVNTLTGCQYATGHAGQYPGTAFQGNSRNTLVNTIWAENVVGSYHRPFFEGESVTRLEGCTLAGSIRTWKSAQTTFVGCTFLDTIQLIPPSVTILDGCTFTGGDEPGPQFWAEGNMVLRLSDLRPGYTPLLVVQADNNAYRAEIRDCTIPFIYAFARQEASLLIERCKLQRVGCVGPSQTTLVDSELRYLDVMTHDQGCCGAYDHPINVTVRGLRDDGTPQNTDIASDNSPFLVSFQNTALTELYMDVGDAGAPGSSQNLIEDSSLSYVFCSDHSSTVIRRSTIRVFATAQRMQHPESDIEVTVQDSTVRCLYHDGDPSRVTLERTHLNVGLFFDAIWTATVPPVRTPLLDLGGSHLDIAAEQGVNVGPNVAARIIGEAEISPLWAVSNWAPGSTVTRVYPLYVKDRSHAPLVGAPVHVFDALGNLVWSGVTDSAGLVQPEITFDDTNYASEFRVKTWAEGGVDNTPMYFLSSTPITLCPGAHPLSYTGFDDERYPWTTFAAGSDAATWRQLAGAEIPRGGVTAPAAHSGDYEMLCDVANDGVSGLRLDLPVTPTWPAEVTLRAWLYPLARSGAGSSFVGFQPIDSYPSTADWSGMLGYEAISDTEGALHLGGAFVAAPGLSLGRWHVVEVTYDCAGHHLAVSLDGVALPEQATDPGLGAPLHALLGAGGGGGGGARQTTCFDDVNVVLGATPSTLPEHLYSGLSGPEKIADGRPMPYTIYLGNGYPVLGGVPAPGAPSAGTTTLRLALPSTMEFVSSTPAPTGYVGADPVWEVTRPYLGQEQYILAEARVPTGAPTAAIGPLQVYCDADSYPADLLPQYVLSGQSLRPDLWVRKEGPATACPGDTVNYVITAGNSGYVSADEIRITDLLPSQLGGGTRILGNVASLAPGETWRGALSLVIGASTPSGTVLTNWAAVESDADEVSLLNNTRDCLTLVQPTPDPNQMNVEVNPGAPAPAFRAGPGGVNRGDMLRFTIDCENPTGSAASGVYARALLDARLDDNTLSLPSGMSYDPATRTLLWEIGTLPGHGARSASFLVQVPEDARRARPITAQATIYFPSIPLEKPTNITVSVVNGSFADVAWNHWAVLPVELTYENGVVGGYPDGSYRPALSVTRDQMAVFISRALAGGDALVTDPPVTATFSDVPTSFWAFKYVEYARAHGVVGGYSDGTYRPAVPVDRGQMAVFVARAIAGSDGAVPPAPPTPTFPDVTPTSTWAWAQKHVEYAVARGIVSGYGDGGYHPEVGVTRDQMAVFVQRAFALPM